MTQCSNIRRDGRVCGSFGGDFADQVLQMSFKLISSVSLPTLPKCSMSFFNPLKRESKTGDCIFQSSFWGNEACN